MLLFIVLLLIEVPVVPPDSHLCFLETAGGFSSARSGSDQSPPPPPPLCSHSFLLTAALTYSCSHFCPERVLARKSPCQGAAAATSETYAEESEWALHAGLRPAPKDCGTCRTSLVEVGGKGSSLRVNCFARIDNIRRRPS